MIVTPESLGMGDIRAYLLQDGWMAEPPRGRFMQFRAPEGLGLSQHYRLTVPVAESTVGGQLTRGRLIEAIAEAYETTVADILARMAQQCTTLSIRLVDRDINDGSIPLHRFDSFVQHLKLLLRDVAGFTATDLPILQSTPDVANQYVQECRFLQTSRGSFVANVQLPVGRALAFPGDQYQFITDPSETNARSLDEVRDRLLNVIDYGLNRVLASSTAARVEDLAAFDADLISVNAFEQLADLLAKSHVDEMQFSFAGGRAPSRTINTGTLDDYRMERLYAFVEEVREFVGGSLQVDVVGHIVELKSRDPSGNRNHVGVRAVFEDHDQLFAVRLGRRDYPTAIEAHRLHKAVRLAGQAIRMKTQIRVAQLGLFEIIDDV